MSVVEVAAPEISIVLPCLNEVETLVSCIRKAQAAMAAHGLEGEIIVADNGSDDGSPAVAQRLGARVVNVRQRGYGSALRGGIEAARGRYVIMGDADDSYDFRDIYPFVQRLRQGDDLVVGNRFKGGIEQGAMPWKHRWIGNPALSGIGRLFFGAPVGDMHCGMRAFSKSAYRAMDPHTTGMEFASELIVKAALRGMRVSEVPTVLHRDGRSRPPHLRSWHDGWRHLRFMLLFCPRWLFFVPGATLLFLGLILSLAIIGGPRKIGPAVLDIHTLLLAGFSCLIGYQVMVFAIFTKVFAIRESFHPPDPAVTRLLRYLRLETGLLAGGALLVAGLAGLIAATWSWGRLGFGQLDPRVTMREIIPAAVLLALGVQTIFASFFLSVLGIEQDHAHRPLEAVSS